MAEMMRNQTAKIMEKEEPVHLDLEQICAIVHELNAEYCRCIGDFSQTDWGDAPSWQQESTTEGVLDIIKNRTLTFEDQHKSWMEWKVQEGWKFGPKKCAETKEHPCMVPYEELPLHHKVKDELFRNTVLALIKLRRN